MHFLHHGQYGGIVATFTRAGFPLNIAAHPTVAAGIGPDNLAFKRLLTCHGGKVFPAPGSFRHMLGICRDAGTLVLTSDVKGDLPTTFLGRQLRCATGLTKLTMTTGALIVPITVQPDGYRQILTVMRPIDPIDYTDASTLQTAVMRCHEASVLAWPQASRHPLMAWATDPADSAELRLDDPRLSHLRI
jgi:hypothetical protein